MELSQGKKKAVTGLWALITAGSVFSPVLTKEAFLFSVLFCTGLLGCILLLLLRKGMAIGSVRIKYLVPLLVVGVSFAGYGIVHSVLGYIAIGLTFAVAIPATALIMGEYQLTDIFTCIARACIIVFGILMVISFFFGPPLQLDQYASVLGNPNLLANFLIVSIPCTIFLVVQSLQAGKNASATLLVFLLGMEISVCFFSNMRTAMFAVILQLMATLLALLVIFFRRERQKRWLKLARRAVVCVLCFAAAFWVTFTLLTSAMDQLEDPQNGGQTGSTTSMGDSITIAGDRFTEDPQNGGQTGSTTSMGDSITIAGDRFTKGFESNENDAFTSGRLGIWQQYIGELRITGHAKESMDIVNGDRAYKDTNAHNYYIQIAYSAGIPAGLAFAAAIVMMMYDLLRVYCRFIFKRGNLESTILFFICVALALVANSITAAGYMLYSYVIPTYFWVMMGPLLIRKNDLQKQPA